MEKEIIPEVTLRARVPGRAWVVVFSGTAIFLTFGILYIWTTLAGALVPRQKAMSGMVQEGLNAGWPYLTNAEAATPYSLCVILFALAMIAGGKIHDRFGPRVGPITGGLCLALGFLLAGWSKSYGGLILGFGVLGGIGMGLAYAAPIPAALRWFAPDNRGLAAGLIVAGYGVAGFYLPPLAAWLVNRGGLTLSFCVLGLFFGLVVIGAGLLLAWPPPDYVPRAPRVAAGATPVEVDWAPGKMLKTWQFFALVMMFIALTPASLLIIRNAGGIWAHIVKEWPALAAAASCGGLVNAVGAVGTGLCINSIGRYRAYMLNCLLAALGLLAFPAILAAKNPALLLMVSAIAYGVYGGRLALLPAYTADLYGTRNLGMNYALVHLGMGLGVPIGTMTRSIPKVALPATLILILAGIILARLIKKPVPADPQESPPSAATV